VLWEAQLPLQQLQVALQVVVLSLQMAPVGRHADVYVQVEPEHVAWPVVPPQQSDAAVHGPPAG
jgi:hypothetical protein